MTTLALGGLVGLLGAVVMDVPMGFLAEGFTPAYLAASKLQGTTPEQVSDATAQLLHHGVGTGTGVLYGLLLFFVDAQVGSVAAAGLVAAGAVTIGIVLFFVFLVVPSAGFDDERSATVARHWVLSAFVYGVALAFLGPVVVAALA